MLNYRVIYLLLILIDFIVFKVLLRVKIIKELILSILQQMRDFDIFKLISHLSSALEPASSSKSNQVLMVPQNFLLPSCRKGVLLGSTWPVVGMVDPICKVEVLHKAPHLRLMLQEALNILHSAVRMSYFVLMNSTHALGKIFKHPFHICVFISKLNIGIEV